MNSPVCPAYDRSKAFSNERLKALRERLVSVLPENITAVTFGSYARREASDSSDMDYIFIQESCDDSGTDADWIMAARRVMSDIVGKEPSAGGAFAQVISRASLLKNVGGDEDDNQNLTRRMLLLLEGDWLSNQSEFEKLRGEIIQRYVDATPKDHQLALFLLNDIIRFWRTMTVDYAYKTTEGSVPKPWAIRNIKLVFSRKLMYAGGLFAVGMTTDRTLPAKAALLSRLFKLPVIDRMKDICGDGQMTKALASYDVFLGRLEDKEIRTRLESLERSNSEDPIFRELKNEAHIFTRELLTVFEANFHSTHPIRRAVLF
jgi:predicted nucleotidyltransferase